MPDLFDAYVDAEWQKTRAQQHQGYEDCTCRSCPHGNAVCDYCKQCHQEFLYTTGLSVEEAEQLMVKLFGRLYADNEPRRGYSPTD